MRDAYTLRRIRVACGCVMMSYLTLHFVNHALGNISLGAMMWGAGIHEKIWSSRVGSLVLYGAFLIHFALALWALYERRSFRMGVGEIVRIVLGLSIVPLLAHHYTEIRWAYSYADVVRRYDVILLVLFLLHPLWGAKQVLVLIVAWSHGCLGLHLWLRHRADYQRAMAALLTVAVTLPILALLGIAQGVRETVAQSDSWKAEALAQGRVTDAALAARSWDIELAIYGVFVAALAAVLAARGARALVERRRGRISIAYPNGLVVRIPRGLAVLDASRRAGIPHASICGGRARCATCRVRVLKGFGELPQPNPREAQILERLGAARTVRLACQLRPVEDASVLPLLPPGVLFDDRRRRTAGRADSEKFVAILFVDIRQSTALVEKRLPYDVIFLLNHFFEAVGGAVVHVGGAPNQFLGDGMMAIFGMECGPREACRRAVDAIEPIFDRLADMNRTLADDLPEPIRIGIGIHAGHVILGELGFEDHFWLTAIGDTVHVAARLQELTKEFGCLAVLSETVLSTGGFALSPTRRRQVRMRGREATLTVETVGDVQQLRDYRPDAAAPG